MSIKDGLTVEELARLLKMDCVQECRAIILIDADTLKAINEEAAKGESAFVYLTTHGTGEAYNPKVSDYDVTIRVRVEEH